MNVDEGLTTGLGLSNISKKSLSSCFAFLTLSAGSGIGAGMLEGRGGVIDLAILLASLSLRF
jgi:hypothetical protein